MSLNVVESFYSIQGEGASVGVPAYFIRLHGCNLMCGGHNACLMKEGKATWWCDSEIIWRKSYNLSFDDLDQSFKDCGKHIDILSGKVHLVWTGGEPTMKEHQLAIEDFLHYMDGVYQGHRIFNEIETNGSITVDSYFYKENIQQINCSPKLKNSGLPESIRINPAAIKQILDHPNSYFKFVISTEDDIYEIQETYINPFGIPDDKIIIMPGVDNRNDLPERTRFLFEMTKKYGYRGITRQHILAWDKVTGV
ncbi:MAG: 7-carboxy-7-deazaguanine synthase QueE [Clostridia bacterium]|nr:7-carboxy-7-deazaguanine synthase QueE [Clostridia bacterium]